jgi:hypothetical protein
VLASLPPADHHTLTGHEFFPALIAGPFQSGLHKAFTFAIVACLIGACLSWSRGRLPARRTSAAVVETPDSP